MEMTQPLDEPLLVPEDTQETAGEAHSHRSVRAGHRPMPQGARLAHHHLTPSEKARMHAYEALDYDEVTNVPFQRREATRSYRSRTYEGVAKWVLMFIIGSSTGFVAFLIDTGVRGLASLKFGLTLQLISGTSFAPAYFTYIAFNVGFVLIAACLVTFVEPVAAGSGIPEVKAYLNGTNYLRMLRLKTMLVKAVGVIFSVGGGLCVGKEGPLVHTGACLAANYSHLPKLPSLVHNERLKIFRTDKHKRDFVSAGAAAGVASAFGAPIGGILFSLEEASSFWTLTLTWRVFFCAMCSTFTLNIFLTGAGGAWMDVNNPGLIDFGAFRSSAYQLWEVPIFIGMAAIGGMAGALFNRINNSICKMRRDFTVKHKPLLLLEAAGVALLTATVSFWIPYFMQECINLPPDAPTDSAALHDQYKSYTCPEGQYNPMATALFTTQESAIKSFFHNTGRYPPSTLVVFGIFYFVLAVITYGLKIPSGLFVPCIIMGCSFGRLVGELMRDSVTVDSHAIYPGVYALIGAVSMLGGVTRMTISLTVIVLETTNDIQYLLPIMLTLMVSKWVGDFFNISLYDMHVELSSIPFVENAPPLALSLLRAEDIMTTDVTTLRDVETVGQVQDTLLSVKHNGFPVVSASRLYLGNIMRSQMIKIMRESLAGGKLHEQTKAKLAQMEQEEKGKQLASQEQERRPRAVTAGSWAMKNQLIEENPIMLDIEDFATTLSSRTEEIDDVPVNEDDRKLPLDLRPYYNPAVFTVHRDCPVIRVYRLVRSMGLRHLIVVNTDNTVAGIITRKDIRTDFRQDLS